MSLEEDHESAMLGWFGHARRIVLGMAMVGLLLAWLAMHSEIFFADGLRYIAQARAIDRGAAVEALKNAVDHPVYPLAIATVHRVIGGDSPDSWQNAAQIASSIAGVLLLLPFYLICLELLGDRLALPATLMFFAVPLTGHVFADTLSESTFLLFWLTGLGAALRFLRTGAIIWVPLVVVGSGLAYLSRPEGLLLPVAVFTTLALSPRWVVRGLGRRGVVVLGSLLVGATVLVGPYVVMKGGLGTKPSVARLLGTAPHSPAHAVERQKPLEADQSPGKTYLLAGKAVGKALSEAVTLPLLILAIPGIYFARLRDGRSRQWTLLAVISSASLLALVRLHVTGGYCSPRHAMLLSTILIPCGMAGFSHLIHGIATIAPERRTRPAIIVGWVAVLTVLVIPHVREILAPINDGFGGYREAGRWLTQRGSDGSKVVDVTGWSQFYSGRTGYTFADLTAAPGDPASRWVVVREAHLVGPWDYCARLRALVNGLTPVVVFQGEAGPHRTRVLVYDRAPIQSAHANDREGTARR